MPIEINTGTIAEAVVMRLLIRGLLVPRILTLDPVATYLGLFKDALKAKVHLGRVPTEAGNPDCEIQCLDGSAGEGVGHSKPFSSPRFCAKLDDQGPFLIWLSAQGFTAKDIGILPGLSRQEMNACLHRARAEVRQT